MKSWFKRVDHQVLHLQLQLAIQRIERHNKKALRRLREEKVHFENLLASRNGRNSPLSSTVMYQAQVIIEQTNLIQAYDLLHLYCEVLHRRMQYIQAENDMPKDLQQPIYCIVYAATLTVIPELMEIRKQFIRKYGKQIEKCIQTNPNDYIDPQLGTLLSCHRPNDQAIAKCIATHQPSSSFNRFLHLLQESTASFASTMSRPSTQEPDQECGDFSHEARYEYLTPPGSPVASIAGASISDKEFAAQAPEALCE